MIREVKLNTLHMYDYITVNDKDYTLWKKIAEYMHGETALIIEKGFGSDTNNLFLALKDEEKDKELHYMMEQDSMTGTFIGDREGFDKAWNGGEYEQDCWFVLKPEYIA